MNKKTVLVLAGLSVVAAGGQIFTQSRFESSLNDQIAIAKQTYRPQGILINKENIDNSLFGARNTLSVTLTDTYLSQYNLADSAPLSFTLNSDCAFYPFYVVCDSQVSSDSELLSTIDSVGHEANFSVNVLFNSTSATLSFDEFSVEENDGTLTISPLTLFYDGDLSLSSAEFQLKWKGMNLSGSSSGTAINLQNMYVNSEMTRIAENVYASETELTVESLNITSATYNANYHIENIRSITEIEQEDSDTFEAAYALFIDRVSAQNQTNAIENFALNVSLDNISSQTLRFMNQTSDDSSSAQTDKVLAELGQSSHNIAVESFRFDIADTPFKSEGNFTLAPYDASAIQSASVLQKMTGSLNLYIGKSINQAFPTAMPVIEQYLEQGLLTEEEDQFQATIRLKQGLISANDIPLYQL